MTRSRLKVPTWKVEIRKLQEAKMFCTNVLKKKKSKYFYNLNIKDLNGN